MTRRDYYAELGVSKGASRDEIARAFRKQAAKHHPDRNPGDKAAEERFKRVAEAYQVLQDPKTREAYDSGGEERVQADTGFQGFRSAEDVFSRFGDVFGDLFGEHGAPAAPAKGADLRVDLPLTFQEAAEGGRKSFTLDAPAVCASCAGTGAEGGRSDPCPTCRGSGFIKRRATEQRAFFTVSTRCPQCGGSGRSPVARCSVCRGEGAVESPRTLEVSIPPAIDDGATLRLRGAGLPGQFGGEAGDILVSVRVGRHPLFEREGLNLRARAAVDVSTAILGGTVEVPLLQGRADVTVPPGTQPGQQLRLSGKGLRDAYGRQGDLLVEIQVNVPKQVSEEQKRLIREFQAAARE